jgi:uncharacterized protein (TIGR02996 family)
MAMIHNKEFYKAIIEKPSDDNIRLIYSDWLMENGESNYGQFIKTQIELSKCNWIKDKEKMLYLKEQQEKLFNKEWKPPVYCKFYRGFIAKICFDYEIKDYIESYPLEAISFNQYPPLNIFESKNWENIKEICFHFHINDDVDLLNLITLTLFKQKISLPTFGDIQGLENFLQSVKQRGVKGVSFSKTMLSESRDREVLRMIKNHKFVNLTEDWYPLVEKEFYMI